MTTSSTTKKPRTAKTPAQRAQDEVDRLARMLKRITAKKSDLEKQARDLAPEKDALEKRLAYAKQNPDLPSQPVTTTGDRP
jgi:ATP adenylyltransferase/5',5'''-P-1,P-4-tetraphosphate phosphorylase II